MKLLITIAATSPLRCHEALSMAFALAAFDHEIQLQLDAGIVALLLAEPNGKLAKMLSSLELYDMPAAWVALQDYTDIQLADSVCLSQLRVAPSSTLPVEFDSVFVL